MHFLQQTPISSFIGFWGPLPSSPAPTVYPWGYVLSQPLFSPRSCPSRLGNLGGKWSSPTTDCGREEVLLVALMISRVAGGPLSLSYLIVRRFRGGGGGAPASPGGAGFKLKPPFDIGWPVGIGLQLPAAHCTPSAGASRTGSSTPSGTFQELGQEDVGLKPS